VLSAVIASTGCTAKALAVNTEIRAEDDNLSLRDEYRKNVSTEIMRSKEQLSAARLAERDGQLTKAAALYLDVALPLIERQHFKEGRASFDATLKIAPKLSVANQKELVDIIVLICKKRNRLQAPVEVTDSFFESVSQAYPSGIGPSAEKYLATKACELTAQMTGKI
jgi:hypothetical protein